MRFPEERTFTTDETNKYDFNKNVDVAVTVLYRDRDIGGLFICFFSFPS